MTFTLPTCRKCNTEVSSAKTTTENIFVQGGTEETFHVVELSCGCIVQFARYDVDVKEGKMTLRDGFTNEVVLTWDDDEMYYDEDEDFS